MFTYTIYGKNGAECVTGTCATEVAEYWNSGTEKVSIEKHMENRVRQVSDGTPEEFILRPWFELDDIFHCNGLIFPLELTFELEGSINNIVAKFDPEFAYSENGGVIFDDKQFVFKDYFSGKNIDFDKYSLFYGQSYSKGLFTSEHTLNVENDFYPELLTFVVTQHDDILILLEMYYGDDQNTNLAPNIDAGTTTKNETFWFD